MKLAKIEHYRCGEPAGKWGTSSYVWIADDMGEKEFEDLCEAGRESYMTAENAHKLNPGVKPPGYGPSIYPNTPDTITVGELRVQYEKDAAAWKEHNERVNAARKPFTDHLVQVSNGRIKKFWDVPPDMVTDLSWGHNHGTVIDHGETKITDYPPKDEDDGDEL